jgi:hypothetical protein
MRVGRAARAGALLLLVFMGCEERALAPRPQASSSPAGLTPEQAQAVVAKVGDATITLGDFAATLERMNQFDRLRYQSRERRRELLQELVHLELLAQEAERRGLDKRPEVQEAIRQILRDAMLAKAREGLPAPADIPAAQIQAYYDANKEKFREPERRRVSAIVMGDEVKAKEILAEAKAATPAAWGELFFEHSLTAPKKRDPKAPADLAGDLGIVGPPGDPKGGSKDVPQAVQRAVFELKEIGQVHPQLVRDGDRFFIVRLAGMSKGHTRGLVEADRAIRVAILQQMIQEREDALEKELRKRFPVKLDEDALRRVRLPEALKDYKPVWEDEQPALPDEPVEDDDG